MKNKFIVFGVLAVFVIVSLLYFLPLVKNPGGLLTDDNDALIISWHLNKFVSNHSFLPRKILSGNIFYPFIFPNAYTDPYLIDSLIAYPFILLSGEPVVAFTVNLILSQVLLLFFLFIFLKELSRDSWISFALSLVFCFSQIRLHYLGHLQMFSLYWVPLAGYFLFQLAKSKKIIFVYLFFISFLLQTLNSFLPGYFILFLALGMFLGLKELRQVVFKNLKHFILGGFLTLLILFPYTRIYLLVSGTYHYVRPITDAINFSLSPEEIFTKFLSPAILFLFFSGTVIYFIDRKKDEMPKLFFSLVLGSYLMALGPALHYFGKSIKLYLSFLSFPLHIPLPYFAFYYLLPGFKGFRTPSRWIFLFGLFIVIFSALELKKYFKDKPQSLKITVLSFVLLLTAVFLPKPTYFPVLKTNQYPLVYQWLAKQPGRVVVEMPIFYWRDMNLVKTEAQRMLFSLSHNKMMVNGVSGFTPEPLEIQTEFLQKTFPKEEAIKYLKNIKVDYLIIHNQELKNYWQDDYQEKIKEVNRSKMLFEVYRDDKDSVYQLQ